MTARPRNFVLLLGTLLLYSLFVTLRFVPNSSFEQEVAVAPAEEVRAVGLEEASLVHDAGRRSSEISHTASSTTAIAATTSTESPSLDEFSSCLMVMDDNHRLTEWIAYHYFVMNLRYLVILPDPRSTESPKSVLDKWRKYMTIVEWTDADYFTEKETRKAEHYYKHTENKARAQEYHNMRQDNFLRDCTKHMREHNRTWISLHDVDEYYVLNSELVNGAEKRMSEPGSVLTFVKEIQGLLETLHELSDIEISNRYVGPCVTTFRTLYGAVESTEEERNRGVPSFLDARRFDTLRWRQHREHKKPQLGKSLLDLTRVTEKDLENDGVKYSPHQTLQICPPIGYHSRAFLHLNHYFGNWASYSYRKNDGRAGGRKTRASWEAQSNQTGAKSGDDTRPWIGGFVRLFGETESQRLLEGCGLDPDYEAPITGKWLSAKERSQKENQQREQ
jgi:hypothetical protein